MSIGLVDRDMRLRQRIDELSDQRDQALAQLEQCRAKRMKLHNRVRTLEQSRELWRQRAMQQPARKRIVPSERTP
jgi:phage shock protein A